VLSQFALTGLVRGQFGALEAASGRYVYVAAVFLLLMVTPLLRDLPWRGIWGPALVAWVAAAVALNGLQLREQAHYKNGQFARQDAAMRSVAAFRYAPGLDQAALFEPGFLPGMTVRDYLASRDQLGSPLPPTTVSQLSGLDAGGVDGAVRSIFPIAVTRSAESPPPGTPCRVLAGGARGDFVVPSRGSLWITSSLPGKVALSESYLGPVPEQPTAQSPIEGGEHVRVSLPDTGTPVNVHIRVQPPGNGETLVCGA
jgi:hypothetical protein